MNKQCLARPRLILSLFTLSTVMSSQALAFGSDEHREISNLALKVAVDFVCLGQDNNNGRAGRNCEKIRRVQALFDEENRSYGHINELVDYMTHPEQIFERFDQSIPREEDGVPRTSENLNQHVFSLWEARNGPGFTNRALSFALSLIHI